MKSRWDSDSDDDASIKTNVLGEDGDNNSIIETIGSIPLLASNDDSNNVLTKRRKLDAMKAQYNPLFEGCRDVNSYQRLNYIEQGTYGVVFRAKCMETGDIVAIKQVKMDPTVAKQGFPITALREINILLTLRHSNIVNVREMVTGNSPQLDKIYMVMDYYSNDLKSCMDKSKTPFSIAEVYKYNLLL